MLGHFGFHSVAVGNVGRVGHHQVDPSIQLGKQSGPGDKLSDVGANELHRGALGVAARVGEGRIGVIDADNPRGGPVLGQGHGQRARSGAQVDDQEPRRQWLRRGPRQDGLGLRARYEHTGADAQHHRPERRRPGEMLQRHSLRARGHDVAVTPEEFVAGRLE